MTVLTVGPEDAKDAPHKALSMDADKAIHVEDDDLHGTDATGTSWVLAKAIEKAGYDLVISGRASTDGAMGVVLALLASEALYPSFKGIMAAKRKPVETWDLSTGDRRRPGRARRCPHGRGVGDGASGPYRAGVIANDEGEGGKQLTEFHAGQKCLCIKRSSCSDG